MMGTHNFAKELEKEADYVAYAMDIYGGGFVRKLGKALDHADSENKAKIKETWPEYWRKYLKMGLYLEKVGE